MDALYFDDCGLSLLSAEDFQAAGTMELGLFTDESRYKGLVKQFLATNRAFRLRVNDIREHLFPEGIRPESLQSMLAWLDRDIGALFAGLTGHLSQPPKIYRERVSLLVEAVPEDARALALARLTFACWMFDRMPEALIQSHQAGDLLIPWIKSIETLNVSRHDEIVMAGEKELREGTLSRRQIVNPMPAGALINLRLPDADTPRSLVLPANARINALFADEKLCCLKGAIACGDAGIALTRGASGSAPMQRLDARTGRNSAYYAPHGETLTDYASDGKGGAHLLIGGVLSFSDDVSEDAPLRALCAGQTILGVYSRGGAIVAVNQDGHTLSNIACLNALEARAVVEDVEGDNLYVLTPMGEIRAILPDGMTRRGLYDLMFRRFPEGAETSDPVNGVTERVQRGPWRFALTAGGALIREG